MQSAADNTHAELRLAILERQVAELTAALNVLRHGLPPAAGLPKSLTIPADDVGSFGVGFYPREFDQHGVPFRWTGNGAFFELRALLDRSLPARLEMRLRVSRPEALNPVSAFVDYAGLAAELVNRGPDLILSCKLPAAPACGRVVVTVYAPNTAIDEKSVPGQAGNKVGVMFFGATIAPLAGAPLAAPGAGVPRHG